LPLGLNYLRRAGSQVFEAVLYFARFEYFDDEHEAMDRLSYSRLLSRVDDTRVFRSRGM
jgi:hypothetical protein